MLHSSAVFLCMFGGAHIFVYTYRPICTFIFVYMYLCLVYVCICVCVCVFSLPCIGEIKWIYSILMNTVHVQPSLESATSKSHGSLSHSHDSKNAAQAVLNDPSKSSQSRTMTSQGPHKAPQWPVKVLTEPVDAECRDRRRTDLFRHRPLQGRRRRAQTHQEGPHSSHPPSPPGVQRGQRFLSFDVFYNNNNDDDNDDDNHDDDDDDDDN